MYYTNPNYGRRNFNRSYYYNDAGQRNEYKFGSSKYPQDNYNEQEEYYENEFYKTNYHNKQGGYYDQKYEQTYDDKYYNYKGQDKPYPNEKTRSKDAYDKFIEEQFYQDNQDEQQEFKEGPSQDDPNFFDDNEKFYEDDLEENKYDQDQNYDDEELKNDDNDDRNDNEKKIFFNDEDFQNNPNSMFNAFSALNQDFSLFASAQDDAYEQNNPLRFDFMDDPFSNKYGNPEDEFSMIGNLDELREKSENFNYDLANKQASLNANSAEKQ